MSCVDDPVATKGVHQHRPLPYQQVARSMQHQYGLLFSGLDRHKAHRLIAAGNRLYVGADGRLYAFAF
jgi:hypothetical protein